MGRVVCSIDGFEREASYGLGLCNVNLSNLRVRIMQFIVTTGYYGFPIIFVIRFWITAFFGECFAICMGLS